MTAALHTLLQHAERQRDESLGALARAEESAQQSDQQGEQLLRYRDDYRQRHPAQGGRSASIELLRYHQGFMERLDQAIAQQQVLQQQAHALVLQQCSLVLELQTRVASVQKLIERRGAEARQHEARLEQRRSDEASQRGRVAHGNEHGTEHGTEHGLVRNWRTTGHAALPWQNTTQAVPL